jgi:hypothetical protein
MWWTIVAVAVLSGGLLDVCMEQLEYVQIEQPEGYNELEASTSVFDPGWITERQEFPALPDAASQNGRALIDIYGGNGAFLTSAPGPKPTFDVVNFEFWEGSPSGWVEYVEPPRVIDCETRERLPLPGEGVLLVHFDDAHRDASFGGNPVSNSVVVDARQVCDHDGSLEWVIAVRSRNAFKVESSWITEGDFEYSVVSVSVLR